MKIAINGDIIDTCDIFKITDININYETSYICDSFNIIFYNDKKMCFYGDKYNVDSDFLSLFGKLKDEFIDPIEYVKSTEEYKNSLKKITDFRDSIVKIWSENQTLIPQFNL